MDKKCECNYHLGMGPNMLCPVHGRLVKTDDLVNVKLNKQRFISQGRRMKRMIIVPIARKLGLSRDNQNVNVK